MSTHLEIATAHCPKCHRPYSFFTREKDPKTCGTLACLLTKRHVPIIYSSQTPGHHKEPHPQLEMF